MWEHLYMIPTLLWLGSIISAISCGVCSASMRNHRVSSYASA